MRISVRSKSATAVALAALVGGALMAHTAGAQATRFLVISNTVTTASRDTTTGPDILQRPEIDTIAVGDGGNAKAASVAPQAPRANNARADEVVHRHMTTAESAGGGREAASLAVANAQLAVSFDGLNDWAQRRANGGNQFTVEPPDQGMCAGNGFVMESVNDVLRVYDTQGNPKTGVIDLNTFYGYVAQVNRTAGLVGPAVTDPSCYYDADTQRWFQIALTLDVDAASGAYLGPNHIDIAVSQTSDPTGAWSIYRLPVQDDGTQGTPSHGCSLGPCIGDYPHLGADANGFYVTTNEYSLFGPEFHGAQIYAFSKHALARNDTAVQVTQFDTHGVDRGNSGFTIWPATSPASDYAPGTEYFLSSNAADEAHGDGTVAGPRSSNHILVWALTRTDTLDSGSPALSLKKTHIGVHQYSVPPPSNQKAGDYPQGQCLNDAACATNFLLGTPDPFAPNPESTLDSLDTRMQQVVYANGLVYGALDTAVKVGGATQAGIEYFIVRPEGSSEELEAELVRQGDLALAGNNLNFPAIGVTASGKGVMAFTVVGNDYYPSAGYAILDARRGAGSVQIAAAGLGPQDGFTGYPAIDGFPNRPRWGDYGAAIAVDGQSVWIASEYIGQTCTLAQYVATLGSCGATRTALANWDTRISLVTVP